MKNTDTKDPNYLVTIIAEKDGNMSIIPTHIEVKIDNVIKFLFISNDPNKKECTLDFSSKEWDGIIIGPRTYELKSHENRSTMITVRACSDNKPIHYSVKLKSTDTITPTPTMIIRGGPNVDG